MAKAKKSKDNAFGTTNTDAIKPLPQPEFAPETDASQYDDTEGTFAPEVLARAGAPPTAQEDDSEPPVADDVAQDQADGGGDDDADASAVPAAAGDDDDDGSAAAKVSVPEFPADLLNAAGLTASEAKEQFLTPEALEIQVRSMDARFVQAGQPYQYMPPAVIPAAPERQVEAGSKEKPGFLEDDFGKDWDEDTRQVAVEISKRFQQQLAERDKALQQHAEALASISRQTQVDQQQRYVQEFDGFVSELGDTWKPIFGSGDGYSLPVNSLALQNRVHLDRIASQMEAGRRVYNQPDLGRKDLLSRALRVAFPEAQEKSVRRGVIADATKRQRLVTERPTHRRSKQMTGEERAIHAAENFFKKNRATIDQDAGELEVI